MGLSQNKRNITALIAAVTDRRIVRLRHQGEKRAVLPVLVGKLDTGPDALRCMRPAESGNELVWRTYHLDNLDEVTITKDPFDPSTLDLEVELEKGFEKIYAIIDTRDLLS
jgi:hypothetical protein